MEALGCCGCPPVSPSTSVSFPQVWLPSRDHHSGARPVMGSSCRVLGLNSPHLPSCCLWGPKGPAWAARQVEGLQRIRSLLMLFRGTLGEHLPKSLVQIMRCQDPSVSPFISDVSFPRVFHGGTLGAQSGLWLREEGLGHGQCHPSLPGT